MAENLLIVHGGGPTAVMNGSLYGAIKEAKKSDKIGHIYGANNGTGGFLKKDFLELENVPEEKLKLLLQDVYKRQLLWQQDFRTENISWVSMML